MHNKINNSFFSSNSVHLVDSIIQSLYTNIWDTLAQKAIAQKSKIAANQDSLQILKNFVFFSFNDNDVDPLIKQQSEPSNLKLDEWANFEVQISHQQKLQTKRSINMQLSNVKTNRTGFINNTQKKTQKKNVKTNVSNKSQPQNFIKLNEQENLNNSEEQKRMRENYLNSLDFNQKLKKESQSRRQEEENQKHLQEKFLKEKKLFTYDYSGNIVIIGNDAPTPNKILLSNVNLQVQKEQISKKVDKKTTDFENIDRTTLNSLAKKTKYDNITSKYDLDGGQKQLIQDENTIQAGVKIIQVKGDRQNVKQSNLKYNSNYLKYKLREYKDYVKERKFKQHLLYKEQDLIPKPSIQSQTIISQHNKNKTLTNFEEKQKHVNFDNSSRQNVILPDINVRKINERSSKYFQEMQKHKNKKRVKSTKIDNEHILSSFYYKSIKKTNQLDRSKRQQRSQISINNEVYSKHFNSQNKELY